MRAILHKFCILFCIVSLLFCSIANAFEITPYADTEFDSVTTLLKSTKKVSFRAVTYNVKSSISVTDCRLEKENDNGTWSTVCTLPPPKVTAKETFAYSATEDYSDYIDTGNYRIRATYDADGHTITRYSNERTF